MMRTLLAVLFLAVPVMAGPGSWTATRYGSDETESAEPGMITGNAMTMDVFAHAVLTRVVALAMTSPISADETGAGTATDTVWYELKVKDAEGATNYSWAIETNIHGEGLAEADVTIQGTAWGESLQVVSVTGDNINSGLGQLAVTDSGDSKISLALPPRVTIALAQTARMVGTDNFFVKRPKKSTGAGKICRIRVETDSKAQVVATTTIGHSSVLLFGSLRLTLEMKGSCTVEGIRVTDTFKITAAGGETPTASGAEAPSGGIETKPGVVPTDDPADDEPTDEDTLDGESAGDESNDPGSTAVGTGEETADSPTTDDEPATPSTGETE